MVSSEQIRTKTSKEKISTILIFLPRPSTALENLTNPQPLPIAALTELILPPSPVEFDPPIDKPILLLRHSNSRHASLLQTLSRNDEFQLSSNRIATRVPTRSSRSDVQKEGSLRFALTVNWFNGEVLRIYPG